MTIFFILNSYSIHKFKNRNNFGVKIELQMEMGSDLNSDRHRDSNNDGDFNRIERKRGECREL